MYLTGDPAAVRATKLRQLLAQYQLNLILVPLADPIPGSHWGAPEAGLIDHFLYARPDTPVHSVLHEACHFICMDNARRRALNTDAGGSALEECAVCYLSIVLAALVPGFSRQRMLADMDSWGYSFRLGNARRWFYEDAEDARQWLHKHRVLNHQDDPTWEVRKH